MARPREGTVPEMTKDQHSELLSSIEEKTGKSADYVIHGGHNTAIPSYPGSPCEWTTTHLFFHSDLVVEGRLDRIFGQSKEAELHHATASGYKLKVWNGYSVALPTEDAGGIAGVVWTCDQHTSFQALKSHVSFHFAQKGCRYKLIKSTVYLDETSEALDAFMYVWAGGSKDSALQDEPLP